MMFVAERHSSISKYIHNFICVLPALLNKLVHAAHQHVEEWKHWNVTWIAWGLQIVAKHLQLSQKRQWTSS